MHGREDQLIRLLWLAFAAIAIGTPVAAQPFNYPGGVVDIRLNKQHTDLPELKYGTREPAIIDMGSQWRVLVGLSLRTLPGEYLLYVKSAAKDASAQHQKFTVTQRSYPLHESSDTSLIAINRNLDELSSLDFSNTQQPRLPLTAPSEGQWADLFGHAMQDPDTGELLVQNLVSLTTTEILTVVAPQNAIISKIETGADQISTVYLDHGRGLYSILGGVTDLSVEVGDGVVAGALIAKLPARAGNETPQRLSWQCILNGVFVNPLILTQL